MKSQANELLKVATDILTDVKSAYPRLAVGIGRDIHRLTQLVENRGIGVFVQDLPMLDERLVSALEYGKLQTKGSRTASRSCKLPRLFSGIYKLIFDEDACLLREADVTAIFFLRQLLTLGKKISVTPSQERIATAVGDFCNVEEQLPPPVFDWDADAFHFDGGSNAIHLRNLMVTHLRRRREGYNPSTYDRRIEVLLDRAQRIADSINQELGDFNPSGFIEFRREQVGRTLGLGHGPGAVAEQAGRFFDKFRFKTWSARLEQVFPYQEYGCIPAFSSNTPDRCDHPSRLIAVPKSFKGPRLIAAEPSSNMFCQKITGNWLRDRIRNSHLRFFIDLQDQSLSQDLVIKSSLDRSLATIDLSSASDRLCLRFIEGAFRSNPGLIRCLQAHRSKHILLPSGETLRLKKFASQGSDVTFPVQTLCFLILALAVCGNGETDIKKLSTKLRNKVRVYGDDIIVPTTGYVEMLAILHECHLKVNTEKSFFRGHFRESCGMDSYMGYDVTPVKPKTIISDGPESRLSLIDLANNLFVKGLWNASIGIERRQLRRGRFPLSVVAVDSGVTGLKTFSFLKGTHSIQNVLDSSYKRISGPNLDQIFTLTGAKKIRYDRSGSSFQVLVRSFRSKQKRNSLTDDHSGIFSNFIANRRQDGSDEPHVIGVPERPSLREEWRWEPLEKFFL